MSESSTLPLNVAETGPIFILTTAAKPFSPVFSNDWHPGIADLSTSGSFSSVQTFGLSAGRVTSPVIVIAMNVSFLRGQSDPLQVGTGELTYHQHFATREKYQDFAGSLDRIPRCSNF